MGDFSLGRNGRVLPSNPLYTWSGYDNEVSYLPPMVYIIYIHIYGRVRGTCRFFSYAEAIGA